jgi:hypothetical protein
VVNGKKICLENLKAFFEIGAIREMLTNPVIGFIKSIELKNWIRKELKD